MSLRVKPEQRQQFLAAAEDDAMCSVRDEPGCLRFDVLQDQADDTQFYFYEVYRDQDAFKAHATMPHYSRWRAAAEQVLAEPTSRTRTTLLFPRDYR
ncbi:MAG: antibiotic biosynthesis monooxygenase [Chloroflexota bacterium]|nr:antibiotic biosynthesis monooxygenase [Chloroflexota bacterium]